LGEMTPLRNVKSDSRYHRRKMTNGGTKKKKSWAGKNKFKSAAAW